MRIVVVLLACLLAAVAAPAAAAGPPHHRHHRHHSPPGNSAVDEYSEDVPGPDGDRPVPREGPVFPGPGTPIGRGDDALRAQGRDGEAVARFTSHTGPRRALTGESGDEGGGGASGPPLSDTGARSLPAQVIRALAGGGEGGMGAALPLLLLAAALATAVLARRRRRPTTTS